MPNRNRLNELTGSAYDFIGNRREALLSGIHIRVLSGTAVPANVHTINASHTARKTSLSVFTNNKLECRLVLRHIDELFLDGGHFCRPIKKEGTMDLFTDVRRGTAYEVSNITSQNKQCPQDLELQIRDLFSGMADAAFCPLRPPPFFCDQRRLQRGHESDVEIFSPNFHLLGREGALAWILASSTTPTTRDCAFGSCKDT